ncbi:MAG: ThuA domain-containing protein, partial [Actinomycetota bacterium]
GRSRALVVTGGHSHPSEDSVPSLEAVLGATGFDLQVSEDPEAAFVGLAAAPPDLLVVNALRFTMADERYAELRERWALSLGPEARDAVVGYVEGGGRLLGLHTALVSFDDWDGWGDLLGGSWDWGRSSHGPLGEVEVTVADTHPVLRGVRSFTVTDECYAHLALRAGNVELATMVQDGVETQPASWIRRAGSGRVAVSALGHDRRSLDHPEHRRLLVGLVEWLDAHATDRAGGSTG